MSPSDSSLVRRMLADNAEAFDTLAGRHRPGLVRFVRLLVGDADEAESLAQEALTRAFERRADFRPGLRFGAWLRGIALNVARNHLRSRTRHARLAPPEQLGEAPAAEGRRHGALSGILRQEVSDHLAAAVAELPALLREAFVLRFVEELDYAEMCEITGEAAGTLRVRAHRACLLLRTSLGPVVDTWLRGDPDNS